MSRRDRSPEAVAWEWWRAVRSDFSPLEHHEGLVCENLAKLIEADRRAERARVRRIVRRERAQYTGPDHMVSGHVACDRILAALREGKGTKG